MNNDSSQKEAIGNEKIDELYINLLKSKEEIIQFLKEENNQLKLRVSQLEEVIN